MVINFKGFDSVVIGNTIEQPSQEIVKNTIGLWQADLDTAVRYGGDLTRQAISAMNIRGDKKYVLVDTKVHMLMPGQCPAIPGWHTDGAPRLKHVGKVEAKENGAYSPLGQGPPNLEVQKEWEEKGDTPRFHLLVTGEGCLTQFLARHCSMHFHDYEMNHDLYKGITKRINLTLKVNPTVWRTIESPTCTALEWGWWHLHSAKIATKREFRFLIRITESNYHAPKPHSQLNEILRTQQMVYTPLEFGW